VKDRNLDDNDGLLHDIVDFGLNQVKQSAHTTLGCLLYLDGTSADGTYRLPHKVHINFRCVSTIVSHSRFIFNDIVHETVVLFKSVVNGYTATTTTTIYTTTTGLLQPVYFSIFQLIILL